MNGYSSLNIHFRWEFQWFFSAFVVSATVVPLKVVIGLGKIDFWHFSVSKQASGPQMGIFNFYKFPKIFFSNPMATFNGTTAKMRSKAEKTIETLVKSEYWLSWGQFPENCIFSKLFHNFFENIKFGKEWL